MVATAEILQTKQRFGIIGNCTGLLRAVSRALQIAPTDLSVLITGESGTGKETFPQIIHANSARKHGRYIAVNCGAIPEGTVDSELFGHEKGSFTGALADRTGSYVPAYLLFWVLLLLSLILLGYVYEKTGAGRRPER